MAVTPRSVVCDRVRAQVSLRLDSELSQLETRMVAAHLARCAECREFEETATFLTDELRSAPLEPLSRPVVIRRAARTWVTRTQVGMAAALAIAVLGAVAQLAETQDDSALVLPTRYDTSAQLTREVNQIIRDGRAFSQYAGDVTPL